MEIITYKYEVRHYIDKIYKVYKITSGYIDAKEPIYINNPREISKENVFQGSLSDCDSYIRLKKGGYMR